jgi:predicted DNA repair protein MutK
LVDDTAAIPQYVSNTAAKRELPVIWKITKKSLINKLIIIPIAIGITYFYTANVDIKPIKITLPVQF